MTKVTLYLPFILTSRKQCVKGGTATGVVKVFIAEFVPKTEAEHVWLPPGKHLVAIPTVVGKPFVLFIFNMTWVVTKQQMSATVTAEVMVFAVESTLLVPRTFNALLAV